MEEELITGLLKPLVRAFREVHRDFQQLLREEAEACGVTVVQLMVLYTLQEYPAMSLMDLAERLSLTNSTISGVIDRLEAQGLAERTRSEQDRRAVCLNLTDAGRVTLSHTVGRNSRFMNKLESVLQLPREDLETLLCLLRTIHTIMESP